MTTENEGGHELPKEEWRKEERRQGERRKNQGRPVWSRGPIILTLELLAAVSGLLAIFALVLSFISQGAYNAKTNRLAKQAQAIALDVKKETIQNHKTAIEARRLGIEIQKQRANTIRDNCEDQNARSRKTIKRLHIITRRYLAKHPNISPTQVRALKENVESSTFLIDAIVPQKDCTKVVAKALGLNKHHTRFAGQGNR